jgi:hypothetical protein
VCACVRAPPFFPASPHLAIPIRSARLLSRSEPPSPPAQFGRRRPDSRGPARGFALPGAPNPRSAAAHPAAAAAMFWRMTGLSAASPVSTPLLIQSSLAAASLRLGAWVSGAVPESCGCCRFVCFGLGRWIGFGFGCWVVVLSPALNNCHWKFVEELLLYVCALVARCVICAGECIIVLFLWILMVLVEWS